MFIPELDVLDAKRAAGVLSRLVIGLESDDLNPASKPVDNNEAMLRRSILERAKQYVSEYEHMASGSDEFDNKILEVLEKEAEIRAEAVDEDAAYDRLASKHDLPLDVLQINFNNQYREFVLQDLDTDDKLLATATIRSPDMTFSDFLHRGIRLKGVYLFGKYFNFGGDKDRFLMVTLAHVEAGRLSVIYFIRIYEHDINLFNIKNSFEALERFADVYGSPVAIQNSRGKIFGTLCVALSERKPDVSIVRNQKQVTFPRAGKNNSFVLTFLNTGPGLKLGFGCINRDEGGETLLIGAITLDVDKYVRYVRSHLRREKFVFNERASLLTQKIIK